MATYDLKYPGAAIDAILDTAYHLQQAGYIFRGSASDYSGTPTEREWVIAPAGFSGLGLSSAVPKGSIGICLYNGTSWTGKIINVLTLDSAPTRNSQNGVTSGGVAATLDEIAGGIMETFASLLFDDETAAADLSTKLSYAVKFSVSDVYQTVTHLNILAATTSKAGLLSAADKVKIDSFLTNLRSLTFTDTTASADQGTQITETLKATIGGVQEVIDSITILSATSSKAGLLSASDKAYIDALPSALTNLSNSISAALALMESLVGYYVCDTAAATAAKTVAASGYSLTNGGCIRIKMANANTADNATLNINSTGAKALYYDGAQASATNTWEAGEVLEVYYDGTQYQCASGGGGKFATGEKVRETGITDEILPNNNALVTSGTVYEGVGKYKYSNVELLNVTGSYASGRSNLGVVNFEIGKKYFVHYELSAPQSNKVALIAYLNSTGTSNYQNIAVMQIGDTSMDVVYEPTVTNKYVAIYHAISGSVGISVQITEVREGGLVNTNEFTPVAQDVSVLKSDFNVYKDAIGDVLNHDLGVNDADYIYRTAAGSSNPVDNPNGVRLRVIYELDASTAYHIVASCNYGKGLCCAVYQTIEQAVYAGADYTDVLSATYVPSVEGDVNGGFITFSFCKSDSSVISNEDKAAILAAANISIQYTTISSLDNLQEQINEIKNEGEYVTDLETNEDELYDKVSQQIDDNTLVLLITTDVHLTPMRPESLNHPSIFARMAEIIGADANVSLGDTITETDGDGIYYNRQRLELYMKGTRQSYMPFLYGIGHHEMYGASGGVYGNFTKPKVIGFTEKYTRHIECVYDSNNKSNFYCDFVLQGIRCIFLDSTYISGHPVGFEQATIDWFEDVALVNVPSGYKVLLFSHAPSLNAATFAPSAANMKVANDTVIRGIINTFNDGGGNLIAHFCGHAHCDNVVKQDGMTYTIIQTACAAAIPNGGVAVNQRPTAGTPIYYEDRTVGTINEYCIDIACIHSDTGIINMLRFGVGADRTINP